jgi:centrin-3
MDGDGPASLRGPALALRRKAAKPSLSEEQRSEIAEAFALFDSEKSGSIDYHELKVAMRALGFDVRKAEVKALVAEYDKDGSERVSAADFLEIMTARYLARDPEVEMRKAFALFDEDGTGKIGIKNLRRVARELGENIAEAEMEAMIGARALCRVAPTPVALMRAASPPRPLPLPQRSLTAQARA